MRTEALAGNPLLERTVKSWLRQLSPVNQRQRYADGDQSMIAHNMAFTPDHLAQAHRFEFEVDQSYLPGIIQQCSAIEKEYPIRGTRDRKGV